MSYIVIPWCMCNIKTCKALIKVNITDSDLVKYDYYIATFRHRPRNINGPCEYLGKHPNLVGLYRSAATF